MMNAPNNILTAASPEQNAVVKASAGVGKTYLLVSRLVRLLASGANPDSILAITFTRKAANEIQERLIDRLLQLATHSEQELDEKIEQLGLKPDSATRQTMRNLYEKYMRAETGLRATTFHAFCQDLLRRFPLEADVPPGFVLLERTGAYLQTAWDGLYAEATLAPETELAHALENLYHHSGNIHNTKNALMEFIHHRSDWWAFTLEENDPIAYARERLLFELDIDLSKNPYQLFEAKDVVDQLREFASLLRKHETERNVAFADIIDNITAQEIKGASLVKSVRTVFFTEKNEPRSRKSSNAQKKSLGAQGENRLLDLHSYFADLINRVDSTVAKHNTYHRCSAWYTAGQRFLDHFQRIKTEQRLLDFSDLEWKAYTLLTQSDNALWVQYKLDQRINHLLIDEFQDTNPTQWRLILPLLEEIAAQPERTRSAFVVGDDKQSIFGFRRADARLLDTAEQWMNMNLNAQAFSMDKSRRSSPAIIDVVNRVFEHSHLRTELTTFQTHSTVHDLLPGRITLLPLLEASDEDDDTVPTAGLRNPLLTPRIKRDESQRFLLEGQQIVSSIQALMNENVGIGTKNEPLRYRDIMLLVRNRTHLAYYEQALREAHIPYLSADRGVLLRSREVQDIISLLQFLTSPFNDLDLATVLRSPIFSCSTDDLVNIVASPGKSWLTKLENIAATLPEQHRLTVAYQLLSKWRDDAGKIPIHDLLDKIYNQGNVIARYEAAYPKHLKSQARRHLYSVLALALEIDSGRYPSVGRFLAQLNEIRVHDQESVDETTSSENDAVRILTIHASKGLEAPVVFLADATTESKASFSHACIVNWPAENEKPLDFVLLGAKDGIDDYSQRLIDLQARKEQKENANLLYVALTRPKQFLFISGTQSKKNAQLGWYGIVRDAWPELSEQAHEVGRFVSAVKTPQVVEPTIPIDPRILQPLQHETRKENVTPSESVDSEYQNHFALQRGRAIHRIIQLRSQNLPLPIAIQQTAFEMQIVTTTPWLHNAAFEADKTVRHADFQIWFDEKLFERAFNEMPFQYESAGKTVQGIIDRIVITPQCVYLLDYKTHQLDPQNSLDNAAQEYLQQMQWYWRGVKTLWPDRQIRVFLIFTHICRSIEYSTKPFESTFDSV